MKSLKNQPLNLDQFNKLIQQTGIVDNNYPLTALVWMPYGCKILGIIEKYLDKLFEKYGYERYIFPYLVSFKEFDRINKQINSFETQIYKINDSIVLRPSGESAIYPMFRQWIKSERDLPIKAFQIGSMFRKGSTRGFLRPNETDFFIEAHAAFGSREEAEIEFSKSNALVEEHLRWLGIPILKTHRPPWTNKPVAEKECAFDALLPTGETYLLTVTYSQMQIFSKAFDISFKSNKDGIRDFTYQTEFGLSHRSVLTSIWLLSNQNNLFLLPSYSPIQVVIVQIDPSNFQLSKYVDSIFELLSSKNIRVIVDREDKQLFKRFMKYEKIGVPVRLEIGESELKSLSVKLVRQDNKDKANCPFGDIFKIINQTFDSITSSAYLDNEKRLTDSIIVCDNKEQVQREIKSGKISKMHLCFCEECVTRLQKGVGFGEVIGFKYENDKTNGQCINCHKLTSDIAFYARRV